MPNEIKKFLALIHHTANNHYVADWVWDHIQRFYLDLFVEKNFHNATLSVNPQVPYIWKYGNQNDWGGGINPVNPQELAMFTEHLRQGGGLGYYDAGVPTDIFPNLPPNPKFEDYINSCCVRMTERFNPFDGKWEDPVCLSILPGVPMVWMLPMNTSENWERTPMSVPA